MFISNIFFEWPFGVLNSFGSSDNYMSRAYDIWRHAKSKIKEQPNAFDRTDCISSLKRAIDIRLKSLRTLYAFDYLPYPFSQKKQLEKLEYYGLIRPAILKELFEIRNLIEHNDNNPPELEKCQFYVDITWYFLKSTDGILEMKPETLDYSEGNNGLAISYSISDKWDIYIEGNINYQYISDSPKKDWIQLAESKKKEWNNRSMLVRIEGRPILDNDLKIQFAREYFSAAGYFYEDHV